MANLLEFPGTEAARHEARKPWPREIEDGRHEAGEPRETKADHLWAEDSLLSARRGHLEDEDCRQTSDYQTVAAPAGAASSQLTSDLVTSGQTREGRDPEADFRADFRTSSPPVHFSRRAHC